MAENKQIIELYTELAQNPDKDFGWDKGLSNAQAHGYKQEWIEAIEKDRLTWHHVSNLNYFNGPIAQNYNIR